MLADTEQDLDPVLFPGFRMVISSFSCLRGEIGEINVPEKLSSETPK
jgi:hypothetical protein